MQTQKPASGCLASYTFRPDLSRMLQGEKLKIARTRLQEEEATSDLVDEIHNLKITNTRRIVKIFAPQVANPST
jgi:hypothetical protein